MVKTRARIERPPLQQVEGMFEFARLGPLLNLIELSCAMEQGGVA